MSLTHILFETATGFNIFSISGKETIGEFNDQVQNSMQDFSKFSKLCKLIANVPFTSAENALENINSISEGILTELLENFLKQTFPKSSGLVLGVSDNKLAASVQQGLSIGCISDSQTQEIIRCIRYHINSYTKLKDQELIKAQLGLGHSYSRSKVKFNVHKVDNMIIQSVCLLEQLDKDLNTFYMRIREWYSWHFPELIKIVPENIQFAKLAKFIQNKSTINSESVHEITKILGDNESLAKDVIQAAKSSMGTDLSNVDLESIMHFADRVISLEDYYRKLNAYLAKKMGIIAPNLQALIGDRVAGQLISRAGSLTNLAKYPASTVQILGAEKALFRAIKSKGKTPKYGIIYKSGFISNSPKNKGRIARCLANKISAASRIDCFSDNATAKFGVSLKQQIEDRIKFFNSGVAPKRNLDVMREVIAEVKNDLGSEMVVEKKKENKKRSLETMQSETATTKKDDKKNVKRHKKEVSKKDQSEDEMKVDKKEDKKEKKAEKKEEKKEEKKSDKKSSKKDKKESEDEMKVDKKEDKKEKKSKKEDKDSKDSSSKKKSSKKEDKEDKKDDKKDSKKSSKKDKKGK